MNDRADKSFNVGSASPGAVLTGYYTLLALVQVEPLVVLSNRDIDWHGQPSLWCSSQFGKFVMCFYGVHLKRTIDK